MNDSELELIKSVENGEWQSVDNFKDLKERMERAAAATALKAHRINVRISKHDVESLKVKALEEGLPYQTLVTSILHKYVTGRLVSKN